jgi:hypothetical protein
MDAPHRNLKQKAYEGVKDFIVISCYLWLVLGLFVLYKSVILSEPVSFIAHGTALLNALALGKVMLVAQDLHFAEKLEGKPLIYPTVFKSAAFAIVLGCFKVLEEIGIGLYHKKTAAQSITDIGGGTLNGILILMAILCVLLVPFFAFTGLRSVFGKERLTELFFTNGHLPDESH